MIAVVGTMAKHLGNEEVSFFEFGGCFQKWKIMSGWNHC